MEISRNRFTNRPELTGFLGFFLKSAFFEILKFKKKKSKNSKRFEEEICEEDNNNQKDRNKRE